MDAAARRAPEDGAAVTKAPDDGAAGGADGHDPQPSRPAPGCQGNSSGHDGEGGPGIERAVGEGAGAPPQAERAPRALAPGGDAAPEAVTSSRLLDFVLTVPFRSPLEAEMARRSLTTQAHLLQGVVQKEFSVKGSTLAVWTAEDPVSFRISVNSFLERLPLVIRNIRALRSRPPRSPGPRKGAEA